MRSRSLHRLALGATLALVGCGVSLPPPPGPPKPPVRTMVEVPEPPPAARVEIVPPRPHSGAKWVDGAWEWEGSRWKWDDGGWFDVPRGVFFAPSTTEYKPDGSLLFGPAVWVDAKGTQIEAPHRAAPAPSAGTGQEKGT